MCVQHLFNLKPFSIRFSSIKDKSTTLISHSRLTVNYNYSIKFLSNYSTFSLTWNNLCRDFSHPISTLVCNICNAKDQHVMHTWRFIILLVAICCRNVALFHESHIWPSSHNHIPPIFHASHMNTVAEKEKSNKSRRQQLFRTK